MADNQYKDYYISIQFGINKLQLKHKKTSNQSSQMLQINLNITVL